MKTGVEVNNQECKQNTLKTAAAATAAAAANTHMNQQHSVRACFVN